MTKSDGCTGFPDGYWKSCCEEHDMFYEQGGSWRDRQSADRRLRTCVYDRVMKHALEEDRLRYILLTGQRRAWILSRAMYFGVRIMGSPWCLPMWIWPQWRKRARWGFGK